MTPGARVAAAISVLDDWLTGRPVEQALMQWARGARYAGSKDRAAVRDHVFDALRARGHCAQLGGGSDGRALMLGLLRLQGVDPAPLFSGQAHAPAALTPAEAQPPRDAIDPLQDLPDWMVPHFAARLGPELPALLVRLRERAPLYLRVNTRKATRDQACAALAQEGVIATPHPAAATAIEVVSAARQVKTTAPYQQGWVEPQDLSVQCAVLGVDWQGCAVLDYCAGGGGKALAVAALGAARVVAHDAHPRRMADLPVRAARAGVQIATATTAELARLGRFDVVLCDVPCSGSGTYRRDPEAKWRLHADALDRLLRTQADILRMARAHVRPGGRLVYMTCSLFAVENEAQIAVFLEENPDWRATQSVLQSPLELSDGFFHAVLQAP